MGALAHEGVTVFSSDTAGVIAIGIAAAALALTLFLLARRSGHVNSVNVIDTRGARPAAGGSPRAAAPA